MAGNNINFSPGSHIWFGSLEFVVIGKGYDLYLLPPTGEPGNFPKPAANLRLRSDELKDTWPKKFSYPSVPRGSQPCHDKKVHKSSTNIYHLNLEAGEVLEDLPQQLMCSITDVLASAETNSNSNYLDSDNGNDNDNKGGTSFTGLREMQRFYASATTSSTTSHAMTTSLIASTATSFHGHEGNN
jgi:hypothetical protein